MKKILILFAVTLSSQLVNAQAQWTTSGTNIYNNNTGNVGIGTTNLYTPLAVESGSAAGINKGIAINSSHAYGSGQGTAGAALLFSRNRTTDVSAIQAEAQIAGGNVNETTSTGGYLGLYTNNSSNNLVEAIHIDALQRVGIGTSAPQNTLDVNGTVHSKQVNVDLTGWPDYVFRKAYRLPGLPEVKSYIDQNGHLPDMPSAQEVEKNGLNLGEANKLLTKKVEELTLYLIEKDEQLARQKEINQSVQQQLSDLARQLQEIKTKQTKN